MTYTKDLIFAFILNLDILISTLKLQHMWHVTNQLQVPGHEIEHLVSIRGVSVTLTVIYGPAVPLAFPDLKVETYT